MTKKSSVIKIVAISILLLFLISGFSVMDFSSQHASSLNLHSKNNVQSESVNLNLGTLKNISNFNYFKNVNNSALFGLKNYVSRNYLSLNNSIQTNVERTVTSAGSGLQINSICYGNGLFLIGGENTSNYPLLLLFNESSSKLRDISGILPYEFRAVTTISYLSDHFYIAGIPTGNEIPIAILDLKNMSLYSLSSLFPSFVTGPNVYTSLIVGSELYLGGYYQVNPKSAFLFSYNIANGSIENLTYILPAYSSMLLTLSSNGNDLFIAGIYGNYSSFAMIYNTSTNSSLNVDLHGQIESLSSSAYYDGNFYVGGSYSMGAEFLKIDLNGEVENLSQSFTDDIQINTINTFNNNIFVGGWTTNGSFSSIFNASSLKIIKNIYGSNGWNENGSEMLASYGNGSDIMVGGSVTTQFYNYSGALLGLINKSYSFVDLSNLIPKTYQSITYSTPPLQQFYVYAFPNIVFDNGNITFAGQGLIKNTTYHLYYSKETISINTNAEGRFSYSTRIGNLTPGDYLISLAGQNHTYYNYFAVPYSYGKMIYGSKIPKTNTIGYSNLKDGAVVRDGEYLEFYRQVYGQIPVTSINYLVQWYQILFQNLTSKGWTVAPVNQLGYASQFSINPMTFQYSFWNDYGIVEVSNLCQFTNFPTSNSFIYVNGSEMIVWITYSIVNETYFPWVYATDYVQESPVYNFNYRIEAGQSFVSWYYGNETPSMFTENQNEVQFIQTGFPIGNGWEVSIINDTGSLPEYYQNYSSFGSSLSINLPNGKYSYVIIPGNPLYTSSNATGSFVLKNNSLSFNILFLKSPITIYMQHYTPIKAGSSLRFNVSSIINNFARGPYSINFGCMNSTFNVKIVNTTSILYNSTIIGKPFSYIVSEISNSYGYYNFNYSGATIELIATNLGNCTGLFAFNLWDYYISNYTASLITIPPQFSENFNPQGNFTEMYNNTGISFTLKGPYYKYPMPLAIWIGEGYNNPTTGKFWWAQIGFNNWLNGLNDISFAGWGIFSNIFGSPGGTDGEFPLIPNDTYNFTMEAVSNDMWEFMVNGIPIVEPGLSGFLNTTSNYANGGITFGFEVLSQARAGSTDTNDLLPNPVKIITAMKIRIDGTWTTVPSFSFNNVGENWNNGNSSASYGMNLWGIEGNIQNKSIPQGEFIVGSSNTPLFDIPSYQYNAAYPLYGNYYYPYSNISNFGTFVSIKTESNGTIYINPIKPNIILSLLEFNKTSNVLINFTNFIVNKPVFIKNVFSGQREAMVAASLDNKNFEYGGKFQEIVLSKFSKYNITFTENGLPSGTFWSVTLNGTTELSNSTRIIFSVSNGTYLYSIGLITGYKANPSNGTITLNGKNVNLAIIFTPVTTIIQKYNVTFTETGLPPGTLWYVNLSNGQRFSSTTNTIKINETNGTYFYNISTINQNYVPSPNSGTIMVKGSNVTQNITFLSSLIVSQPFTNITNVAILDNINMLSWAANSYYGDNGFITVGGDGLTFYKNGSFEAPSNDLNGFLLGSAWNGKEFLVVGNTFWYQITIGNNKYQMNNGPVMGIYYPNNNTIVSLDNLIPIGLNKNSSFTQVVWNGSEFLILGEQTFNASNNFWNTILYSFNPETGKLINMTNILPSSFSTAHMTGMINTPYGTFILLCTEYGTRLGLINGSNFYDISSIIPPDFIFNNGWQYGTPMAYGNGLLFIAGNFINRSLSAIVYNPSTSKAYNLDGIVNGINGVICSVSYSEGLFLGYGYNNNLPLLIAINPVNNVIYNISEYIPSGFATPSGMNVFTIASENGTNYLTGGDYVFYGILTLKQSYNITFNEYGLQPDTPWNITFGGITWITAQGSITFTEPNGTYLYSIASIKGYKVNPYPGKIIVNGASITQIIEFNEIKYNIMFTESGLPTGTLWYVNLSNGQTYSSNSSKISFSEPNGTYSYTISTVDKEYAPITSSGVITVNGSNITQTVTFKMVTYQITFTESGLPSGTLWSITFNGATESSITSTITFSVPNGTYSYTVGTVNGYTVNPSSGTLTLSGSSIAKSITFISTSTTVTTPSSGIPPIELYGIIGAIIVIIAVLVGVLLMRRKK